MWRPIQAPGEWLVFLTREDNKNLPIMEVRRKYMQEQLLFEDYSSYLQNLNTISTANASSGGYIKNYESSIKTVVNSSSGGQIDTKK